jgi:hypothetical protein
MKPSPSWDADEYERNIRDETVRVTPKAKTRGKANDYDEKRKERANSSELEFIDLSNWDNERAPSRAWAVPDRIPLRQPTLFSGEGAIGKSLIALQLSVAHVTARDWFWYLAGTGTGDLSGGRGRDRRNTPPP